MLLISIIVALAQNRIIGRDGQIPWSLPDDLRRFKRLTMGQILVMGRRTFESIGYPLPGRRIIVVSRNRDYSASGCEVALNLDDALHLATSAEEIIICGGEELYKEAIPIAGRLYLTELDMVVAGDTRFPEFSAGEFVELHSQWCCDGIPHRFSILQRHNCAAALNLEKIRGNYGS